MIDQLARAETFRGLHRAQSPLLLFNIWDAGSAKAVESAGACALATGSWSVAAAHGLADGEVLPPSLALANLARIVGVTSLPVSLDLESGYGRSADEVGTTVKQAIETGAVGCNLEDSHPESGALRPLAEAAERVAAARSAANGSGIPIYVNARCDLFLSIRADAHSPDLVVEAVERAAAYAAAGADGLFLPGLASENLIGEVVRNCPLPLNILMTEHSPSLVRLAQLGVARVSYGPKPYVVAMKALERSARYAFGH